MAPKLEISPSGKPFLELCKNSDTARPLRWQRPPQPLPGRPGGFAAGRSPAHDGFFCFVTPFPPALFG